MKTLITYLYKEDENTKKNLQFFCSQIENDALCDYFLIVNDEKCTVNIPEFVNVIKQENALDFPSYKTFLKNIDITNYRYFYFINSSCIGPFVPVYCANPWYYYVNNVLNTYDFVGPIAEVPPPNKSFTNNPFIHTYMFGFNNKSMEVFVKLLNQYESFDKDFCIYFERLLSYKIIEENLKIKSFLTLFKNVDLNNKNNWNHWLWSNSDKTCYEIPYNYHGIDIDPYELIFVKNLRKPHEHRSEDRSGISKDLEQKLNNYTFWVNW